MPQPRRSPAIRSCVTDRGRYDNVNGLHAFGLGCRTTYHLGLVDFDSLAADPCPCRSTPSLQPGGGAELRRRRAAEADRTGKGNGNTDGERHRGSHRTDCPTQRHRDVRRPDERQPDLDRVDRQRRGRRLRRVSAGALVGAPRRRPYSACGPHMRHDVHRCGCASTAAETDQPRRLPSSRHRHAPSDGRHAGTGDSAHRP